MLPVPHYEVKIKMTRCFFQFQRLLKTGADLFLFYLLTHSAEFWPSSVKPVLSQSLGLKREAIPSGKHKPQQEYPRFITDCLIHHRLHSHTVFHWAATQSQTHARARWVRNSPMIVFSARNNHRFIHSIPWKSCAFNAIWCLQETRTAAASWGTQVRKGSGITARVRLRRRTTTWSPK